MAQSRTRRPGTRRATSAPATPAAPAPSGARAARAPQQRRGLKRVDEILDAAESVIAEVGVEGATTNAIAERAGASVGSLYHFFPSKDAIVQALARRFQALASHMNARAMPPDAVALGLEPLFERIIMNQVNLIAEHPAFQAVHDAVCLNPRGLADLETMRKAIVGQVVRFLELRYPGMPKRERAPVARLAVLAVQHVLDDARVAPRGLQAGMLRELQRMLVRYFAGFDQQYGGPTDRRAQGVGSHRRARRAAG